MYRYVFANMYRQIQAKSKIVKMAWHIMACVIESKQICGFCGHKKKSRPSQGGADGSCRRCTWSEQASRSFEAWVISRLRTFLMFLCTVCTSIQINHHHCHDYLFSLFCESMWALVYTYVYIYIYRRERERERERERVSHSSLARARLAHMKP